MGVSTGQKEVAVIIFIFLNSYAVKSRFFQPPREKRISSKNWIGSFEKTSWVFKKTGFHRRLYYMCFKVPTLKLNALARRESIARDLE